MCKKCPHCGSEDTSPVPAFLEFECGSHVNKLLDVPVVQSPECRLRVLERFVEKHNSEGTRMDTLSLDSQEVRDMICLDAERFGDDAPPASGSLVDTP